VSFFFGFLFADDYLISLFEPSFKNEKTEQSSGYVGFTPA